MKAVLIFHDTFVRFHEQRIRTDSRFLYIDSDVEEGFLR